MLETWLSRWQEGRTGWHETDGNALLKRYWPRLVRNSRVLVPFSGKAVDMLWLASQGLDVTGIEISEIAARAFFEENELPYELSDEGGVPCFCATAVPVRVYCGDYFEADFKPFHSLYDRGALVAVPEEDRPRYVEKTRSLLEEDAFRLIITLTYDDAKANGPPYSIDAEELLAHWPDLACTYSRNALDTAPPKFRNAGLEEMIESVWTPA